VRRIKIRPKPRIINEMIAGISERFNKINKHITKKTQNKKNVKKKSFILPSINAGIEA
jgi:hypothetical protein